MAVGTHILLEHWDGFCLTDPDGMEAAMRGAADAAGAHVLSAHFHDFTGGGFTGVLMLAESHITVHTWPEKGYAALDIFMCGACDAEAAVTHLARCLQPQASQIERIARGARP